MICSECGNEFWPECDEEEICGKCQVRWLYEDDNKNGTDGTEGSG